MDSGESPGLQTRQAGAKTICGEFDSHAPPPLTLRVSMYHDCNPIDAGVILIVDDDPMMRKLLTQSLNKCGFAVKIAANGQEAIQAAKDSNVKLIIMDASMPKLNGFEASKLIKSEVNPDAKIILLTAAYSNTPIQYRKKSDSIIDSFMRKPFEIKELRDEIFHLIGVN